MASVYRRASGKWAIRYRDERGEWTALVTTARTKAEATKLAFEAEQRRERSRLGLEPTLAKSTATLGELATWWLADRSAHMRSHATNATTLRKHLLAALLAAKRAHEVTSADITNWLAAKQAILSAKTINNLRGYIHAIYVAGRESGRLACANPVERVKRMRVNRRPTTSCGPTRRPRSSPLCRAVGDRCSRPRSTRRCARASSSGCESPTSTSMHVC